MTIHIFQNLSEEINLVSDPNSKKPRHYSDDEKKSGKKKIPSYLDRMMEDNKYPENEKIIYEKKDGIGKRLRRAWCFNDRGSILTLCSFHLLHTLYLHKPTCRR